MHDFVFILIILVVTWRQTAKRILTGK